MSDPLGQLDERLASHPALQAVLDHLVRACLAARFGLAIKGSLQTGRIDRFSDLDVTLVTTGDLDEARRWVSATLAQAGRVLALFPATHLRLEWLWIYFLERSGELVKVDVEIEPLEDFIKKPLGILLSDPDGTLEVARATEVEPLTTDATVHLNGLRHRFTGWTWYTYSKIARGELLEAYDSLGVMRAQALVPTLLCARGLRLEGFRHLEGRLQSSDYVAMLSTVPGAVERSELLRALRAMVEYFESLPSPQSADAALPEPDLGTVIAIVERSERQSLVTER